MKATLTFNLPEENDEFYAAINVDRYRSVLNEIGNHLRNKIKYASDDMNGEAFKQLEEAYKVLCAACIAENIDWI